MKKQFTKKEIQAVANLWESSSKEDIANELDITVDQVAYLARQIRLAGFVLPFKNKKSNVRGLILEALELSGLDRREYVPKKYKK